MLTNENAYEDSFESPFNYSKYARFKKNDLFTNDQKNTPKTTKSHKKNCFDLYSTPHSQNRKSFDVKYSGKNLSKSPMTQKRVGGGFLIDYGDNKSHKYEASPIHMKLKDKKKYFENFKYDLDKEGYKNLADTYFLQNKTVQRTQLTNYDGEKNDFALNPKQAKIQMNVSPQFVYRCDDIAMPVIEFKTKKVNIYEDVEPAVHVINFRKNLNDIRKNFVDKEIFNVKDKKSVHTPEGMENLYRNTYDGQKAVERLQDEYTKFQKNMGVDYEKTTQNFDGFNDNHYKSKWDRFRNIADYDRKQKALEDFAPFSRSYSYSFLDSCLVKVNVIRGNEEQRLKQEDENRRSQFLEVRKKRMEKERQIEEVRIEKEEFEKAKEEARNSIKNIKSDDLAGQMFHKSNQSRPSLKKKVNMDRHLIPDDGIIMPVYLGQLNDVCHEYTWYNQDEFEWKDMSLIDSFDEDKSIEENAFEEMIALLPKMVGLRQKREEEELGMQKKNKKNKEHLSPTGFPLPSAKPDAKNKTKKALKPEDAEEKQDDSRFKEAVEKTNLDYDSYAEFHNGLKKFQSILTDGVMVTEYDPKGLFGGANKRKLSIADNFTTIVLSKEKDTKIQKAFSITNCTGLTYGKKTNNLRNNKKASETRCFSVIMNSMTIDFEVQDDKLYFPQTRGIEFLIIIHRRLADDLYIIERLIEPKLAFREWQEIIEFEKPLVNFN